MLRLHDASGAVIGLLPKWLGDPAAQEELNDCGAFSFDYPRNGKNADLLLSTVDAQVSLVVGGDEVFRGLVEDDGDPDEIADAGAKRPLTVSGRGTLAILERGVTLPQNGVGTTPAQRTFTSATPGLIVRDLVEACQALGFLTGVDLSSFTDTTDSNGQPWAQTITVRYDAGIDLLTVITALCSQGVCDTRMDGLALQLYNPETVLGVDRPATLVRRKHLQKLPRKRSRRDLRSDVLVVGQDGINTLRSDATAQATYGKRLGYLSQGNTTDPTTLDTLGDNFLAQHARPSEGWELPLQLDATGCPQPWSGFGVGDFIRCDQVRTSDGTANEPLRVRKIAYTVSRDGLRSATVTCNDLFLEATIKLARRVDGIDNGYIADTGGVPVGPETDTTAPGVPTGLNVTTAAAVDDNGVVTAQISASWLAPALDGDGGPLNDLANYLLRWRYQGDLPWHTVVANDTQADVGSLIPGRNVEVQVSAVDGNGNASAWTATFALATASDVAAPPQPSAPAVTDYLGQLKVAWDGLGSAGEAMPSDFARCEVHVSTVAGFTPDATTLRGSMLAAGGEFVVTGLTYGTTYYVQLVAVDTSGNASAPSAEGNGVPTRVSGLDVGQLAIDTGNLADLAVSSAKIADLAVITAKIADLAVDSAKIADLAVGDAKIADLSAAKITAGDLSADVTVSGRIATALSGARVEISSSGVHAYNAGGVETVTIGSDGEASVVGTFRTGAVGGSRLELLSQTSETRNGGRIRAYSGATAQAWLDLTGDFQLGDAGSMRFQSSNGELVMWPASQLSVHGAIFSNGAQISTNGGPLNGGNISASGTIYAASYIQAQTELYATSGRLHFQSANGAVTNDAVNRAIFWFNGDARITEGTNSIFTPIRASAFTVSSSREVKKNLAATKYGLQHVLGLKVMDYEYADVAERAIQDHDTGLIAEEVAGVYPPVVAYSPEGRPDGIDYGKFAPLLIKAVQELTARVAALEGA